LLAALGKFTVKFLSKEVEHKGLGNLQIAQKRRVFKVRAKESMATEEIRAIKNTSTLHRGK
jgi:hypothetical protein